jgi:hypothetical protein
MQRDAIFPGDRSQPSCGKGLWIRWRYCSVSVGAFGIRSHATGAYEEVRQIREKATIERIGHPPDRWPFRG